ncbi:DUF1775 domain-containing protein [Streptomyces sp. SLBN-118]|uniref:DUF1775 domain-containing protein n=1 Tax=Streptomyces sp. SLBN-118 TaxID=2768454 RepID=UPI0016425E9F|nr:DUF1775 domain-containing protein [Streptomyces sp. SLBN-118]
MVRVRPRNHPPGSNHQRPVAQVHHGPWTPSEDGSTVGGKALATRTDAVHSITVTQLPDAKSLAFKTIETYGDGTVDRWIELPGGGAEPENPAPVLALKPAAPGPRRVGPHRPRPRPPPRQRRSRARPRPGRPRRRPRRTTTATAPPSRSSSPPW